MLYDRLKIFDLSQKHGMSSLTNEVRGNAPLLLGREINPCCFPGFFQFQQPCHVTAKNAHDLQTFLVLHNLLGRIAVYHIPIAGAGDEHLSVQKILVHLIQRRGRSGAPGGHHRRGGLEGEGILRPAGAGVEPPVHEAHQGPVHTGVEHRRAEDEAVIFPGQHRELVDFVLKDAFLLFRTGIAADAAPDGLILARFAICLKFRWFIPL